MGAKSPLLWDKGQVDNLLAGSPVVNMVKERLKVLFCPCTFAFQLGFRIRVYNIQCGTHKL